MVNTSGVIRARSVENRSGTILLLGDMDNGTVQVGGTLDAGAPDGGDGGFIETSAHSVQIADGTTISTLAASGQTGTWLIDPYNFTISSGGAAQTTSGIGADTLSSNLGATDVTLSTDTSGGADPGDINVDAAVSWSAATTLTLNAYNDININAAISGTNGGLTLEAGNAVSATAAVSVGAFTLNRGAWNQIDATLPDFYAKDFRISGGDGTGGSPYQIADVYGLQGIGSGRMLGSYYILANNIDAGGTQYWNSGAGFKPIGDISEFTGSFNGGGYTITGLTINRPGTDYVCLFGYSSGAIGNVGLVDCSITGNNYIGGLAGFNNAIISDSFWNTDTYSSSGVGASNGSETNVTGLNTEALMSYDTFSSVWDISKEGGSSAIWRIYDGYTYPLLSSFLTPLTVTAASGSRTYDGTTDGGLFRCTVSTAGSFPDRSRYTVRLRKRAIEYTRSQCFQAGGESSACTTI